MTRACVKQALRMCRSRASVPKGGREGSAREATAEWRPLFAACVVVGCVLGRRAHTLPQCGAHAARNTANTRAGGRAGAEPGAAGVSCATERSGPCRWIMDTANCVVRAAAAPWVRLALVRRASVARIGVGSVRI
jgi:hypothetical protein